MVIALNSEKIIPEDAPVRELSAQLEGACRYWIDFMWLQEDQKARLTAPWLGSGQGAEQKEWERLGGLLK